MRTHPEGDGEDGSNTEEGRGNTTVETASVSELLSRDKRLARHSPLDAITGEGLLDDVNSAGVSSGGSSLETGLGQVEGVTDEDGTDTTEAAGEERLDGVDGRLLVGDLLGLDVGGFVRHGWFRDGEWCRGGRREREGCSYFTLAVSVGVGVVVDRWRGRREGKEERKKRKWCARSGYSVREYAAVPRVLRSRAVVRSEARLGYWSLKAPTP